MNTIAKTALPLPLSVALLAGCKKDVDTYYALQSEPDFFNVGILGTTFNTTFAARYSLGKLIPITSVYNQIDNPATITVFQATKTDSMQVGSYAAAGTFNPTFQATTQAIPCTVPATYALNKAVRLDITLTFANEAQRRRRISYLVTN